MAAAEVLAPGSTAANSSDIVVATQLKVSLKGSADGVGPGELAQVVIELKDEDGLYWPVAALCGCGPLSVLLEAAGTYRARRIAARDATNGSFAYPAAMFNCGVFTG